MGNTNRVMIIIGADGNQAVVASQEVAAAYKKLSTESIAEINKQKASYIDAYNVIKNSGMASAAEIRQAELAKNKAIEGANQNLLAGQQSLTSQIKAHWIALSAAVASAMIGINKAQEYAEIGAKALQAEESFAAITKSANINADATIAAMKRMTAGTIDESDLMQKAVKGLTQGMASDDMIKITAMARVEARRNGMEVGQTYNEIAEAIANNLPRALRRFGLVTKEEMALLNKAATLGIEDINLLDIAWQNATIHTQQLGGMVDNATEAFQRHRAEIHELKESIGKGLITVMGAAIETAKEYAAHMKTLFTHGFSGLAMNPHLSSYDIAGWQASQSDTDAALAQVEKQKKDVMDRVKEKIDAENNKSKAETAAKAFDAWIAQVKNLNPLLDEEARKINEIYATAKKMIDDGIDKKKVEKQAELAEGYIHQKRNMDIVKKTAEEILKALEAELKMRNEIERVMIDGEIKQQSNIINLEIKRIELAKQAGYINGKEAIEQKVSQEERLLDLEQRKVDLLAEQMTDDYTNIKNMEAYAKQTAVIIDLEEKRLQLQREKVYQLDALQIENQKILNDLAAESKRMKDEEYAADYQRLMNMANNAGPAGQGLGQAFANMKGINDIDTGRDEWSIKLDQAKEHYAKLRKLAEQSSEYEFQVQAAYNDMMRAEDEKYMHQKLAVTKNGFGMAAGLAQAFYELSGKQNEEAFYAWKAFAIAEAVMNIALAVTKAFSQGGFWGFAMAAAVAVAGAAQIATIASAEPGSEGTTASAGGYSYSSPTTPTWEKDAKEPNRAGAVINIYVEGNIVDQDKFARELAPSLRKAWEDAA